MNELAKEYPGKIACFKINILLADGEQVRHPEHTNGAALQEWRAAGERHRCRRSEVCYYRQVFGLVTGNGMYIINDL